MLIGFSGYDGTGNSPDGIGQYVASSSALAGCCQPLSGCAPGSNCCASCASQPATGIYPPGSCNDRFWHPWRYPPAQTGVGAVEERAGVLLETGIGAFLGYMFAPKHKPQSELVWVGAGAALGGLVGKWGLGAILAYGIYERYRKG